MADILSTCHNTEHALMLLKSAEKMGHFEWCYNPVAYQQILAHFLASTDFSIQIAQKVAGKI